MIFMSLVFLLLIAAVHKVQSQDVTFYDDSVSLTCPDNIETGLKWMQDSKSVSENRTHQVSATDGAIKGHYTCQNEQTKHHFFINAKVCHNCYELSGFLAAGVIFGDLLITGGVILIVYLCVPKKNSSTQQRASNQKSAAPRPPNPDYAALNPKTQSRDLYAGIRS